jgi:hypothetical protein
MKKPYEKPAIVYSQPIEARAVACSRGDDACRTNGGPVCSD